MCTFILQKLRKQKCDQLGMAFSGLHPKWSRKKCVAYGEAYAISTKTNEKKRVRLIVLIF